MMIPFNSTPLSRVKNLHTLILIGITVNKGTSFRLKDLPGDSLRPFLPVYHGIPLFPRINAGNIPVENNVENLRLLVLF